MNSDGTTRCQLQRHSECGWQVTRLIGYWQLRCCQGRYGWRSAPSVGKMSKKPYDKWVRLQQPEDGQERQRWILIRRSLQKQNMRAYFLAAGPATSMPEDLVRVAGGIWAIEE